MFKPLQKSKTVNVKKDCIFNHLNAKYLKKTLMKRI